MDRKCLPQTFHFTNLSTYLDVKYLHKPMHSTNLYKYLDMKYLTQTYPLHKPIQVSRYEMSDIKLPHIQISMMNPPNYSGVTQTAPPSILAGNLTALLHSLIIIFISHSWPQN